MKQLIPFILMALIAIGGIFAAPRNRVGVGNYILSGYIVSHSDTVIDSFPIPEQSVGRPFFTQIYQYGEVDSASNILVKLIRGYSTIFNDTFLYGTTYNTTPYWADTTGLLAAASSDSTWYEVEFFTQDDTLDIGLVNSTKVQRYFRRPYNWMKLYMIGQGSGSPGNPDSSRVLVNLFFYSLKDQIGQ